MESAKMEILAGYRKLSPEKKREFKSLLWSMADGNGLQIYANPEFGQIRAVSRDGQIWFVAADVCRRWE